MSTFLILNFLTNNYFLDSLEKEKLAQLPLFKQMLIISNVRINLKLNETLVINVKWIWNCLLVNNKWRDEHNWCEKEILFIKNNDDCLTSEEICKWRGFTIDFLYIFEP